MGKRPCGAEGGADHSNAMMGRSVEYSNETHTFFFHERKAKDSDVLPHFWRACKKARRCLPQRAIFGFFSATHESPNQAERVDCIVRHSSFCVVYASQTEATRA